MATASVNESPERVTPPPFGSTVRRCTCGSTFVEVGQTKPNKLTRDPRVAWVNGLCIVERGQQVRPPGSNVCPVLRAQRKVAPHGFIGGVDELRSQSPTWAKPVRRFLGTDNGMECDGQRVWEFPTPSVGLIKILRMAMKHGVSERIQLVRDPKPPILFAVSPGPLPRCVILANHELKARFNA